MAMAIATGLLTPGAALAAGPGKLHHKLAEAAVVESTAPVETIVQPDSDVSLPDGELMAARYGATVTRELPLINALGLELSATPRSSPGTTRSA